jgi:hypothetical protein
MTDKTTSSTTKSAPLRLQPAGTPPYRGGMEARAAVLEEIASSTKETLGRIDARLIRMEDRQSTDFRLLFAALIAVALGLSGLMAKGFHWL